MRIRRLALLSAIAAAIAGVVLWMRSQSRARQEEDVIIELDSTNGGDTSDQPQQEQADSRVPL